MTTSNAASPASACPFASQPLSSLKTPTGCPVSQRAAAAGIVEGRRARELTTELTRTLLEGAA